MTRSYRRTLCRRHQGAGEGALWQIFHVFHGEYMRVHDHVLEAKLWGSAGALGHGRSRCAAPAFSSVIILEAMSSSTSPVSRISPKFLAREIENSLR